MIDHVTIKVRELAKSKDFYQKAFIPFGWKVAFGENDLFWAFDIGGGFLFEIAEYQGENSITSTHIAFRAKNQEQVQEFYKTALEAGAKDNGQPGPRPKYTKDYYACFVLDPDGHNIEAMWDNFNRS